MGFLERENLCESAYSEGGPFWHLCTPGNLSGLIFKNKDDMKFGMTIMAICANSFPDVRILAFAIMSNHIHIVLSASFELVEPFFKQFKRLLTIYCSLQGRTSDLDHFNCKILPVNGLRSLRNTIAYVNRNGYVADPHCTPFSYRWGTGRYIFNDIPLEHTFGELTVRRKREICHSRDRFVPDHFLLDGDYPAPVSYCPLEFVERLFRDAHHYMSFITKNVESYADIAKELGDTDFMTDDELYSQLMKICLSRYRTKSPADLKREEKIELAREMHYQLGAKNNQIRRMLAMSPYEIDALFPLSARQGKR